MPITIIILTALGRTIHDLSNHSTTSERSEMTDYSTRTGSLLAGNHNQYRLHPQMRAASGVPHEARNPSGHRGSKGESLVIDLGPNIKVTHDHDIIPENYSMDDFSAGMQKAMAQVKVQGSEADVRSQHGVSGDEMV